MKVNMDLHHNVFTYLDYVFLLPSYIYIYIYIYIITVVGVTKLLCGSVSNQVQYNMESAQYLG